MSGRSKVVPLAAALLAALPAPARAQDAAPETRLSPRLEKLSAAALYRTEGTGVAATAESPDRFGAAFSRKATPSYYWGVRYRPDGPRTEAEYAYKILDKLVLGTALGYHAYHPGALVKSERYELGGSVDYRVVDAHLTRATILHAAFFPTNASAIGVVTRHDGKTAVTLTGGLDLAEGGVEGAATRFDGGSQGKLGFYAKIAGWRPGLGVGYEGRWRAQLSVARNLPD